MRVVKRGHVVDVFVDMTTGMITFEVAGLRYDWRTFSDHHVALGAATQDRPRRPTRLEIRARRHHASRHMETYCAWCGARIGASTVDAVPPGKHSHGICAGCTVSLLNEEGTPVEEFLHTLGVPVFLVSDDVEVLDANQAALALTRKSPGSVMGHLGGEVFECVNAELPGGCGQTIHCSGCALRLTVTATYLDGIPRVRVPASLKVRDGREPQTADLFVTTARVDGRVLLKVELAR